MFALLFIIIMFSVVAAISFYRLIAVYSVKIAAYALDYALVFGVSAFYVHQALTSKVMGSWIIYAIDGVVALLATLLYGIIILVIHHRLPKMSSVLNFIIVVVGVSIAFPLALDFISSILKIFGTVKDSFTQISLFGNQTGNLVLNYGIILLLAIPVYMGRMRYLNQEVKNEV